MEDYIEKVYESLTGELLPENQISWVKDAFAPGSPCDLAYGEMLEAYERLRVRLGVTDEDADVEVIISRWMDICHILGREMFCCGAEYQRRLS